MKAFGTIVLIAILIWALGWSDPADGLDLVPVAAEATFGAAEDLAGTNLTERFESRDWESYDEADNLEFLLDSVFGE